MSTPMDVAEKLSDNGRPTFKKKSKKAYIIFIEKLMKSAKPRDWLKVSRDWLRLGLLWAYFRGGRNVIG